ncbi:MAG: hypothetical protein IPK04_10035 [Bdellovibrionales bacterium]|nr:hypothetical protein [Bdellovibrionales bacterium]
MSVLSCIHPEPRQSRNPAVTDSSDGVATAVVTAQREETPVGFATVPAASLLPTPETYTLDDSVFDSAKVPLQMRSPINKYFSFLKLDPTSPTGKVTFNRLLFSSTQFLVCADFEDWQCLESSPVLQPNQEYRREVEPGLGRKISVDAPFLIKPFFTKKFFTNGMTKVKAAQEPLPGEHTLAMDLGEIIDNGFRTKRWGSIDMALFGIDDLEKSMKPVWSAIVSAQAKLTKIRGVFDIEKIHKTELKPIYVSFRENIPEPYAFQNLFSMIQISSGKKATIGKFEYKDSVTVIKTLNRGVTLEQESLARLEWPISPFIMHNKFFVFSDEDKKPVAVWTGTANVSRTCMGTEANANMSVYVTDPYIAKVFSDEFKEMYEDIPSSDKKPEGKFSGIDGPIVYGKFHTAKRPQTQRYFSYNDGTEVRVHFSPTDDGEHRAIIPTLLSARSGDEIRISMFASGGIEYVRAIQYAVAQGAHVKIVFDRLTNSGCTSWINNVVANIRDENPYVLQPTGTLDFKVSAWSGGKSHHKTGTLSRFIDGRVVPEVLIIGSQNWTAPGNDKNDENMLTIRNRNRNLAPGGLAVAGDFNKHFDEMLWKAAIPMPPRPTQDARCRGLSIGVDPEESLSDEQTISAE